MADPNQPTNAKGIATSGPTNQLTYQQALEILSTREIEVLKLAGKGYTNTDIARELNLSPRTVQAHRNNMCVKLGLRGPNGLIKWLWSEWDGKK